MIADLRFDDERRRSDMPAPLTESERHRTKSAPRIWTVFVAYLAAFVGSVVVQVIVGVALAAWYITHGGASASSPVICRRCFRGQRRSSPWP
jgi:hypothetical protein